MKKLLTLLSLLFICNNSWAATYTCSGKVTGLSIEPSTGNVLVEKIGPLIWPKLCSVETEINRISIDTCKTIYSTLLTAQLSQKNVTLWFNDSKDCTADSHTPWGDLTGWYFGPKISD